MFRKAEASAAKLSAKGKLTKQKKKKKISKSKPKTSSKGSSEKGKKKSSEFFQCRVPRCARSCNEYTENAVLV